MTSTRELPADVRRAIVRNLAAALVHAFREREARKNDERPDEPVPMAPGRNVRRGEVCEQEEFST